MRIEIGAAKQVIPGPRIPSRCRVMRSNNNLDVVLHDSRLWLAWRTSPNHFAGSETLINVISSQDMGETWEFEEVFSYGRDLREPRFLVWDEHLYLYWFEAGTNPGNFEPERIFATRREGRTWRAPVPISDKGYVVWRPRVIAGRALMSVYSGGETIYTIRPKPTEVEIWESRDGFDWAPIAGKNRAVHIGGTETDFALLDDGRLLAVTRKEGPQGGWGTDICLSDVDDWTNWHFKSDRRKLDSPLMFAYEGRYYVIARRQIGFGGNYDLGLRALPKLLRTRLFQSVYWITQKRTALWEVNPETLTIEWLADFPSRGDTAFAGIIEIGLGEWLIYNYSSPLEERDRVWIDGQLSATNIYVTQLKIN